MKKQAWLTSRSGNGTRGHSKYEYYLQHPGIHLYAAQFRLEIDRQRGCKGWKRLVCYGADRWRIWEAFALGIGRLQTSFIQVTFFRRRRTNRIFLHYSYIFFTLIIWLVIAYVVTSLVFGGQFRTGPQVRRNRRWAWSQCACSAQYQYMTCSELFLP